MAGYMDLFTSFAGGSYILGRSYRDKRKSREYDIKAFERADIMKSLRPPKQLVDDLIKKLSYPDHILESAEDGVPLVIEEISEDLSIIYGSEWRSVFSSGFMTANGLEYQYNADALYDKWVCALSILLAKRGYAHTPPGGFNTTPGHLAGYAINSPEHKVIHKRIVLTCRAIERYIQAARPEINAELKATSLSKPGESVRMDWDLRYDL